MKKFGLVLCIGVLLLGIFGCSANREKIKVSKDIDKITVMGNGLWLFIENEKEQLNDRKIVLEQEEEIEVMLKAIENSTTHSGPMTNEGENLNLIFTFKDDTAETIHLWLYPDRNSGRIQKENYEGPIQILSKEDVQNIAKLLAKKMS